MGEFKNGLIKSFRNYPMYKRHLFESQKSEILKMIKSEIRSAADAGHRFLETDSSEFILPYWKEFCKEEGLEMHADKVMQDAKDSTGYFQVRISGWDGE